jgi:hypothetical protein
MFLDVLQGQPTIGEITEEGLDEFRRHVRTVLPFLPSAILTGQWCDFTEGPVLAAVDAILASTPPPTAEYLARDPEYPQTCDQEAHYITGLVVGLAVANALLGARGPQ